MFDPLSRKLANIPLENVLSEFGLTMADWDTMGKTPLPGENGAGNG
jgi:hypothetical protein